MFMPSIYDTKPGIETLKNILAKYPDGFKRKVAISAVDANTGERVTMTDEDVAFEDFHIAVIGSASVPGAFPPTPFKDHLFMDGMTAYNTDVQATIDRCRQITGNDDKLITIDIIQCSSPDNVKQMPHPSTSALEYIERKYALHSVYVGSDVVKAV